MLEIQGSILGEDGHADVSTALNLGKLLFPAAQDVDKEHGHPWDGKRVFLYIGKHQRMTGEVKKLSRPLAAIRRREGAATGDHVEIVDIIRYKMLFAHRPEPVGVVLED